MSNKSSIFTVFSVLVGVMLFGIWSNIQAYAQQSSSLPSSTPTGSSVSKPISQELKAKMCDPSNPSLKVVNTTEARICGIPKTVKPPLASTMPQTSTVSSSTQQTLTKPTTTPAAPPPKQQQQTATTTTNNNTKAISRPTVGAMNTTIAPVSHPTSTSPAGIAPQVKAVNQHQQQSTRGINSTAAINSTVPPIILINGTAGQNYTFAATSPAATSDQLLYLRYHGTTNPTHGNSGPKHDDSRDSKPHTHRSTRTVSNSSSEDKGTKSSTPPPIKIIATNNDSIGKKTSSTKVERTDSANDDPKPPKPRSTKTTNDDSSTAKKKTSSTNDDGSSKHSDDNTDTTPSLHQSTRNTDDSSPKDKSKSDPKPHTARTSPNDDTSDATSSSRNEDSESPSIDNDIPSVIVKSFNSKHSTDSDSSDKGGDSFFDGDKFFSDDGDSGF